MSFWRPSPFLSQKPLTFIPSRYNFSNVEEEESYDIKGSTQLRNAIAKYHQKHYPNLNPQDNILVACGAQVGMSVAIAAFVDPSD